MIKICLTGPESTGKSTLCRELSDLFSCSYIPEVAREYLEGKDSYTKSDLRIIAEQQLSLQEREMAKQESFVFFDTSFEVIKIWSEYRFGSCDPWISDQFYKSEIDLYLLCSPDIPWESDPQRENPHDRIELFNSYQKLLTAAQKNFIIVESLGNKRLTQAVTGIRKYLASQKM
jgi:nicotinamide riboside kinase